MDLFDEILYNIIDEILEQTLFEDLFRID